MKALVWLLKLAGSDTPELDAHLMEQRALDEVRSGKRKADPRALAKALAEHGDQISDDLPLHPSQPTLH